MPHSKEQRRQHAMARYLAGDKIEEICRELSCSKSWLYKWKKRYQATDPCWATEQTRRPRSHPSQTPPTIAQAVVDLHRTLRQRHRVECRVHPAGAGTARDRARALTAHDLSHLAAS